MSRLVSSLQGNSGWLVSVGVGGAGVVGSSVITTDVGLGVIGVGLGTVGNGIFVAVNTGVGVSVLVGVGVLVGAKRGGISVEVDVAVGVNSTSGHTPGPIFPVLKLISEVVRFEIVAAVSSEISASEENFATQSSASFKVKNIEAASAPERRLSCVA